MVVDHLIYKYTVLYMESTAQKVTGCCLDTTDDDMIRGDNYHGLYS
jgi:hypothetical protein